MTNRAVDRAKAWAGLSQNQRDRICSLAEELRHSGLVTDRRHKLTTRHQCFIASESIDWMVRTRIAVDRSVGECYGQLLLMGGLIHSLDDDVVTFLDKQSYFRFVGDEPFSGPSITSLASKAFEVEGSLHYGWLRIRGSKASVLSPEKYCVLASLPHKCFCIFQNDLSLTPIEFLDLESAPFFLSYLSKHSFMIEMRPKDSSVTTIVATCSSDQELDVWVKEFVRLGSIVLASANTPNTSRTIYDFSQLHQSNGHLNMNRYRNKVLLAVNVSRISSLASLNFVQLQILFEKYAEQGLVVIAFPCDQFDLSGDTADDVRTFAQDLGVRFPIVSQISVNGMKTSPLFALLKAALPSQSGCYVEGNFVKFLVGRDGIPAKRFDSDVLPLSFEDDLRTMLTGEVPVKMVRPSPVRDRSFTPANDPRISGGRGYHGSSSALFGSSLPLDLPLETLEDPLVSPVTLHLKSDSSPLSPYADGPRKRLSCLPNLAVTVNTSKTPRLSLPDPHIESQADPLGIRRERTFPLPTKEITPPRKVSLQESTRSDDTQPSKSTAKALSRASSLDQLSPLDQSPMIPDSLSTHPTLPATSTYVAQHGSAHSSPGGIPPSSSAPIPSPLKHSTFLRPIDDASTAGLTPRASSPQCRVASSPQSHIVMSSSSTSRKSIARESSGTVADISSPLTTPVMPTPPLPFLVRVSPRPFSNGTSSSLV